MQPHGNPKVIPRQPKAATPGNPMAILRQSFTNPMQSLCGQSKGNPQAIPRQSIPRESHGNQSLGNPKKTLGNPKTTLGIPWQTDPPNLAVQGGDCTYSRGDSARQKEIPERAMHPLQQRASEAVHGEACGATVQRI